MCTGDEWLHGQNHRVLVRCLRYDMLRDVKDFFLNFGRALRDVNDLFLNFGRALGDVDDFSVHFALGIAAVGVGIELQIALSGPKV